MTGPRRAAEQLAAAVAGNGAASDDASRPTRVLLVADPGLPHDLARRAQEKVPWDVTVTSLRLPADDLGHIYLPDDLTTDGQLAVILTDHPERDHLRPIVAEVDRAARTAVVSLPSLGARRLVQRTVQAIERVVAELAGDTTGGKLGPFPREAGDVVRFVTSSRHGTFRILAGMVRANRPWRLLPHLSTALAAALAVLAWAGLLNETIWLLAGGLDAWRMVLSMLVAIALMVTWLIVDHEMWERPETSREREVVRLFNAATVVTLVIGVVFLYAGLLAIGFAADRVLLDSGIMSTVTNHPATYADHLAVVWLSASVATVAGAVGTGFESDEAVRQAAYGYRQRERLQREAEDKKKASTI